MARPASVYLRAGACCLVGTGFALAPLRFAENAGDTSRWLVFTGGFHPLVLHLPIGILIAIAAFEAWSFARGKNEVTLRRFLWLVAATSASVSFLTGYELAAEGGHNPELLRPHLWLGGCFTALCWFSLGLLELKDVPFLRLATWTSAALPMLAAGHFGGLMVHGSPFANAPWHPDPTAIEVLPPLKETIAVHADLVQPILTAKCQSCHGPGKQNGRLRLDSLERAFAGGAHGPTLLPGHAKDSLLLQAVLLPVESEKHMPPKNRPQLSQAEIDLLQWWIEMGASGETHLAAKEAPDVVKPFLVPGYRLLPDRELIAQQEREAKQQQADQERQRTAREAALAQLPASSRTWFHFTGTTSADLEFAVTTSPEAFGDEQLATCQALLSQCTRITLADTKITDDGLAALHLSGVVKELNLKRTPVTNQGMKALGDATNLELLNLYGTAVGDGLAAQLPRLAALHRLFLGETRLSEESLVALRGQHSQTEILGSLSVPPDLVRSTPPATSESSNP